MFAVLFSSFGFTESHEHGFSSTCSSPRNYNVRIAHIVGHHRSVMTLRMSCLVFRRQRMFEGSDRRPRYVLYRRFRLSK